MTCWRGTAFTFVHGYIEEIDLLERHIRLESDGDYAYEYLVLALGSVVNYFDINGAEENSWSFRTQDDAFELSTHIRDCLQQASRMDNSAERRQLLTFALMGGGPSGVELASTLGDLLPKWYVDMGRQPQGNSPGAVRAASRPAAGKHQQPRTRYGTGSPTPANGARGCETGAHGHFRGTGLRSFQTQRPGRHLTHRHNALDRRGSRPIL